ncbi:MAG: FlgB family protein [Rhodobacteraceae bacterium]|jgi:flagellar basal-body rod protein FlgB|nr:FlgB family protein [Paracoccaceae bacterium]
MYKNIEVFRVSHAMATHAGSRQAVIARNMANSDTPGYVARDLVPFAAVLEAGPGSFTQKSTRMAHLNGIDHAGPYATVARDGAMADPNGNTVSVETEMAHAVSVKRQHDRAVAIYKSALGIMRSALGR